MKSLTNLTTFVILFLLSLTIFSLAGCGSGGGDAAQVSAIATGAQKSIAPSAAEKFVPDELLIQFYAGVSKEKSDEVLRGLGVTDVDEIKPIRVKRIKVPEHALEHVKEALAKNPHVKFVEKNFIADPVVTPNDPSLPVQWHLAKISAPQGWDISSGVSSVKIGIADSGVDPTHPDLATKLLPGFNFYDYNTDTRDVYGHGTQVAGSAAAATNNAIGVSGVAWANSIVPLRVTDTAGYAYYSTMASAITYCADNGIRIINLSFSGTSASSTLQSAVDYAWNKGTIVFAAAGNSASTSPSYPAACYRAVAVAASTSTDTRASFSNYGSWITVAAPGSAIYTTAKGGGYASVSGTSFASPITAAVGAMILSVNQSLSAQQVVDILKQSTDDLGLAGFDNEFGYGRVNLAKALDVAQGTGALTDSLPPAVAITSPASGNTGAGLLTVATLVSDNVGVTKVELRVNGVPMASDATEPFTFLWDSTKVANGLHAIDATAFDAQGNSAVSEVVIIDVQNSADVVPPVVTITSPLQPSITGLKKVTISVKATDNIAVSSVDLYINGIWKTKVTGGFLFWSWNLKGVTAGSHVITAVATDAAGNVAESIFTVVR